MDLNFDALNQGATMVPAAVKSSADTYAQLLQNSKAADMFARANPDLEAKLGMQPGQFGTLSAQQKVASLTGYFRAQGAQQAIGQMAESRAQAAEALARANYFQSFGAERQAQAQMQSQDDAGASRYAQALDQQINNPDQGNPQAVAFAKSVPQGIKMQLRAAAQIGRTDTRTGAALVRPLLNYFSSGAQTPTGAPPGPGTGPTLSKDGAYYYDTHLGAWKPAADRGGPTFKMVPDPTSETGVRQTVEANNLEDFQAGMKALGLNPDGSKMTNAPAASAPGPSQLPDSADKLVKGNIYQTGRGPAVWDGNMFQPMAPADGSAPAAAPAQ